MLRFVIRKMISKKWMVLALLIGNILLIGITASNPMYTRAVLQRTLNTSFQEYLEERNRYPAMVTIRASSAAKHNNHVVETANSLEDIADHFGLPIWEKVGYYYMMDARFVSDHARSELENSTAIIGSMTNLKDHVEWIHGEGMNPEPDENGVYDVAVSQQGLMNLKLIPGEVLTFERYTTPEGEPLKVRIAAVFGNDAGSDAYWVQNPGAYDNILFMHEDAFDHIYFTGDMSYGVNAVWYLMMDYNAVRVENVPHLLETADYYAEYFEDVPSQSFLINFTTLLEDFQKTEVQVRATLWVLQVPIFVLLAAFIFMVAKQMLEMEQSEIAVLKSRGAGSSQVICVYLIQSIITALIALVIAVPLGVLLVQVLGSANAFLEFVNRGTLKPEVNQQTLVFAGVAALFSICAMVLPVFKHTKVTIVNHKQRKHRKSDAPFWQRFFVDFLVLGVALYGLFSFNNQKEYLSQSMISGASLDPLLFLSSSLFMLGAGLVALRVLPAIVWVIFTLFKKWWSPALYASFLRVLRTRNQQGFIMIFLIMTIALGVFNSSAARTINAHDENNLRYVTGADVVLKESWSSTGGTMTISQGAAASGATSAVASTGAATYVEPDYDRYTQMEGAQSVAKVYIDNNGTMSTGKGGTIRNITIMGIDTKDFGETAWFDEELLPQHWYEYLNAMSQKSRAVILSTNFKEYYDYKIGDVIYYRTTTGDSVRGIIYGFVDYWPSYARYTYYLRADGTVGTREAFLVVANLNQLQVDLGVQPYKVWMKVDGDTQFIYDYAEENKLDLTEFVDVSEELVRQKNDPVVQGTNGMLTVGFIVVLVLCAVGFLIYWVLSIKSRELQFGIFRAMGMSMREILTMLLNEHVFISAAAILIGAGVGLLTSNLFMPLIQIAYSSADSTLPLTVIIQNGDMIRLAVIVGAMVLVCLTVLAVLIRRMKIAQALKLGED